MIKKTLINIMMILFLVLGDFYFLNAQGLLDFESGVVTTGYNNIRIPGNQGTRFSFNKDLEASAKIFYRVRLNYRIGNRHNLSVLYAPLTTSSEGRIPSDIDFAGVLFPANADLRGSYKFNSYRLTYRYEILQGNGLDFGLGLTAKIRDAKIALSTAGLKGEKSNVGFVPIINFRLFWHLNDNLGLLIDGDALAAKQGRAEDVLIAVTYRLSDLIGLKAGYRILEGGADNDEVYNFALFHYASLGVFIYL